jgi:hypothetical protein
MILLEPPNNVPFRGLPVRALCAYISIDCEQVNECIIYRKSPTSNPYPTITLLGKAFRLLRVVAEIWYSSGIPLTSRDVVCHTCDFPPRIAPNHLILADQSYNIKDMYSKGRQGDRSRKFDHKGYRIKN